MNASVFLGRSRSWRPLPLALTTGTGLIMGLQLGFATGAYSGYHSVKDLPSSQYLISLAKDVRMEFLAARGQVIDPGQCRPRSMTEQEKFEYQQSLQRQERRLNSDPEMGHSWDTHQSSQQDAKDQPGST
ncbi:hypothetical protein DM01DRAFT_1066781 [Hesseltinella vesiculosa]|uniref:Uncharacterized protein n=1 Tax=Hesseltinella vesiculosa TaxID=101127 RepID=A0A1X2GET0_9FUNG|nr:hypothetical protein DM01DRAFT_1066781 [Hesseltinella vesiculosa]